MRIEPLLIPSGKRILVIMRKREEVTEQGVLLPEADGDADMPTAICEVIAISDYLAGRWAAMNMGSLQDDQWIELMRDGGRYDVGDFVVVPKHAGDAVRAVKVNDDGSTEPITVAIVPVQEVLGIAKFIPNSTDGVKNPS